MKKIYLFSLVFVIAYNYATAQTSWAIEWQKSFGGSSEDAASSAKQTPDGGYIVIGSTYSNDGDVGLNHGILDIWIIKLNSERNIEWKKILGGSSYDDGTSIELTPDGGYIASCRTSSNDGDVTNSHGGEDYWIIKLNSSGIIQWQKILGGSGNDGAYSIKPTSDGGYIVTGISDSNDGDVSGNHGSWDYWVVKLNGTGVIQWQKSLGGSGSEYASYSIQQTSDGGYIVSGYTDSNDGNVSGNHGDLDYWVVKLDSNGAIQWQKSLGGSNVDYATSIAQTSEGGYIVAGYSFSNDGDVSGNHGQSDYWVVKLNGSGNIEWQKSLGGSDYDYAYSIRQTHDGGYIIAGGTNSYDGDVSGNHGDDDAWIVKLNSSGDLQWQYCLGGSQYDGASSIDQTFDDGYIIAGFSNSSDGDVSNNHGDYDYWIVKLKPDNILPVTMLALTGKAQGKQNILNWATATEQNNTGFEVQRSGDGYNFSKIGFVNTKAVNGSSNLKLSYDFSDIGFAASANYYRLKQIDKDGKSALSNIVLLRDGNTPAIGDVSVYPNPAKNIVTVKISLANSINIKLAVTDMSGKTIFTKSVLAGNGETIVQVDASRLSTGSYFIKIISDNGKENVVKKFVKE